MEGDRLRKEDRNYMLPNGSSMYRFLIWSFLFMKLNEMFNNLQQNHLLPEKCRVEFSGFFPSFLCLGDGEVGLAYRLLPAAFLWFSAAFFLCYKWISCFLPAGKIHFLLEKEMHHIEGTLIYQHQHPCGISHFKDSIALCQCSLVFLSKLLQVAAYEWLCSLLTIAQKTIPWETTTLHPL